MRFQFSYFSVVRVVGFGFLDYSLCRWEGKVEGRLLITTPRPLVSLPSVNYYRNQSDDDLRILFMRLGITRAFRKVHKHPRLIDLDPDNATSLFLPPAAPREAF